MPAERWVEATRTSRGRCRAAGRLPLSSQPNEAFGRPALPQKLVAPRARRSSVDHSAGARTRFVESHSWEWWLASTRAHARPGAGRTGAWVFLGVLSLVAQVAAVSWSKPDGYYYFEDRGCSSRNELGSTTSTLQACADSCTQAPTCVSFEMTYMYSTGTDDGLYTCQRSTSCVSPSMISSYSYAEIFFPYSTDCAGRVLSVPEPANTDRTCGAACHASCDKTRACSSASASGCNGCDDGYFSEGGTCKQCTASCPAGSFLSAACTAMRDTECTPCAAPCFTCDGASSCRSCEDDHFLDGDSCTPCRSCETGQFETVSCTPNVDTTCETCGTCDDSFVSLNCSTTHDAICGQCDESCDGCIGPSSTDCRACAVGFYRGDDNACKRCSKCSDGTFVAQACSEAVDTTCSSCDEVCESCSGPRRSDCTSCASDAFPLSLEGAVRECAFCDSCPSSYVQEACNGTLGRDAVCGTCSPVCNGCFGPGADDCNACAHDHFQDSNMSCIKCSSCLHGEYTSQACTSVMDTQCTACSPLCESCIAGSAEFCTSCAVGAHPAVGRGDAFKCVPCASCDDSWVEATCNTSSVADNTVCGACDASCATCLGPSPNQCVTCGVGFFKHNLSSAGLEFPSGRVRCLQCEVCDDNQYVAAPCTNISQVQCGSCSKSCSRGCTGPTSKDCVSCAAGFFLDAQMACSECQQCPDGFVANGGCVGATDTSCTSTMLNAIGGRFDANGRMHVALSETQDPCSLVNVSLPNEPHSDEQVVLQCAAALAGKVTVLPAVVQFGAAWSNWQTLKLCVQRDRINDDPAVVDTIVSCELCSFPQHANIPQEAPCAHADARFAADQVYFNAPPLLISVRIRQAVWPFLGDVTSALLSGGAEFSAVSTDNTGMRRFSLTLTGAERLTLFGDTSVFLDAGPQFVPGAVVTVSGLEARNVTVSDDGSRLSCTVPTLQDVCGAVDTDCGYHPIVVRNPGVVEDISNMNPDTYPAHLIGALGGSVSCPPLCPSKASGAGVFYSAACAGYVTGPTCLKADVAPSCGFGAGSACVPCPYPAAVCPSGFRVWPQPGFWVSEESDIDSLQRCAAPATERCMRWDAATLAVECGIAYSNAAPACGACATGHYPTSMGECLACPPPIALKEQVVGMVWLCLGMLAFVSSIGVTVVLVDKYKGRARSDGVARVVAFAVWAVSVLQVLSQVSKTAGPGLPSSLAAVYESLSVMILELPILHPACSSGHPFGQELRVLSTSLTLVLGSFALIQRRCRPESLMQASSERSRRWRRKHTPMLRRALFTVSTLLYPLMSSTALSMVNCRSPVGTSGAQLVASAPWQRCGVGPHKVVHRLSWVVLVVCFVGYPVGTFLYLRRKVRGLRKKRVDLANPVTTFPALAPWLSNDFQPQFYWFRHLSIVVSALLGMVIAFGRSPTPAIAAMNLMVSIVALAGFGVLLWRYRPYFARPQDSWKLWVKLFSLFVAIAGSVLSYVQALLANAQLVGSSTARISALTSVVAVISVAMFVLSIALMLVLIGAFLTVLWIDADDKMVKSIAQIELQGENPLFVSKHSTPMSRKSLEYRRRRAYSISVKNKTRRLSFTNFEGNSHRRAATFRLCILCPRCCSGSGASEAIQGSTDLPPRSGTALSHRRASTANPLADSNAMIARAQSGQLTLAEELGHAPGTRSVVSRNPMCANSKRAQIPRQLTASHVAQHANWGRSKAHGFSTSGLAMNRA